MKEVACNEGQKEVLKQIFRRDYYTGQFDYLLEKGPINGIYIFLDELIKKIENIEKSLQEKLSGIKIKVSNILKEKKYDVTDDNNLVKSAKGFFERYKGSYDFVKNKCNPKIDMVFYEAEKIVTLNRLLRELDYSKIVEETPYCMGDHYKNLLELKNEFEKRNKFLENLKKSGFIFSGTSRHLKDAKSFIDNFEKSLTDIDSSVGS